MIKKIDTPEDVLAAIALLLEREGLSIRLAADEAGVSPAAMAGHLAAPPRVTPSPRSLALYRRFLNSRSRAASGTATKRGTLSEVPLLGSEEPPRPSRPHVVVDLFSGCGGLSLGFDLHGAGDVFETVLALDLEAPMIEVLNANRRAGAKVGPGRRINIEDFLNEEEILAFYLDHYADMKADVSLRRALDDLPEGGLFRVKSKIDAVDLSLNDDLQRLRQEGAYRAALREVDDGTFTQTSVEAFAHRLRLPLLGSRWKRDPLLWASKSSERGDQKEPVRRCRAATQRASELLWDSEVKRLESCLRVASAKKASGPSKKIASFLRFLKTAPMQRVRTLWSHWTAMRTAIRQTYFGSPEVAARLRLLYSQSRRVDVVLGGPPCQGFSRVGRGKMRSLQDGGANVHTHDSAGDARNLLFEKYVQFVSALQPDVFLFENVATFRTKVIAADGPFHAADALEEAFDRVSDRGVHYAVSTRTLQCSEYGIPQSRARFFMAGLRRMSDRDPLAGELAIACLSLQEADRAVPLRVALRELPRVTWSQGRADLADPVPRGSGRRSIIEFLQRPIGEDRDPSIVDGHVARRPRDDDEQWFGLMAAGTRWMDYRCDDAPTVNELRWAVSRLATLRKCADSKGAIGSLDGLKLDRSRSRALTAKLDDQLAVRLIEEAQGRLQIAAGRKREDYTCKKAPTLQRLRLAIRILNKVSSSARTGRLNKPLLRDMVEALDKGTLKQLLSSVDGSLSLRLLLEQIDPPGKGAGHHLLREVYLSKKSGHHGDWLKRLDPSRPCRTIVSHMAKDTYSFVHPFEPRMLSVREAARIQTFPDAFTFGAVGMFHAFRMIGNAVPPLLSHQLAARVARILPILETCLYGGSSRNTTVLDSREA